MILRPVAAILFALLPAAAGAQDAPSPMLSPASSFAETDGAALFANVCQACHMPAGQGAAGAGHYPALAKNANLETGAYPVYVVVHGLKGMPPVGKMMTDDQVAAVVNYLRTHFGNSYADPVTAKDVADARN
ncbi:c-type cytochrome [Inquilinus limosus]|uniref:c-type cytochrome n=1 Tax=Inquilinus limosus TaxID=171674 RepID=UPI000420893E|nr:cytochrome c [Inquilinus limosus]